MRSPSDLTDLMGGDRVVLCIFGHTQRVADVAFDGTRVLSNPRGYPHEAVDALVVDLPLRAALNSPR